MAIPESIRADLVKKAVNAYTDNSSMDMSLPDLKDKEVEKFVKQIGWEPLPNIVQPIGDVTFFLVDKLRGNIPKIINWATHLTEDKH